MKPDAVFALENAGWPALLLDAASTVLRANAAAIKLLGPALEGTSAQLGAVWAATNSVPAEQYLAQWERAPASVVSVKLKVRGGAVANFPASLCTFVRDEQRFFLLQLSTEAGAAGDSGAAHKQKLDCALQLARTVSLDFNNALTSILGHTSLVLSKMEIGHPWRASLLEVEKSAAKAAEIASDLGTFSRQEKEARAQAAGNLNQLLQRTVEFFQHNTGTQSIAWSLLFERRLYTAKFDEAKMQQAFMKILENSIQSLRDTGRVTVQTRNLELTAATQDRNVHLAAGAYVCAEITDNGCGIETDVLPRIFEPFFTTKKAAGHRGLGLAWVYGIVTNHGGGVAVSSQPGVGTSVRVYLPAGRKIVRETAVTLDDLRGTQTILVVDDEDLMLTVAETILTGYGYSVITANSGPKALDVLTKGERPVDLVVTDLVMPGMSGRELVENVHRQWPGLRVLRTSGYVWPANKEEEASYLQKPFTSQELLFKVKQMLTGEATPVD
jgi:two-component system, cell cycle sensor histidine kinase and response regulator CckA